MTNEMMRRWNSLQKMILARKLREDRREKVSEVLKVPYQQTGHWFVSDELMHRGLTGAK